MIRYMVADAVLLVAESCFGSIHSCDTMGYVRKSLREAHKGKDEG